MPVESRLFRYWLGGLYCLWVSSLPVLAQDDVRKVLRDMQVTVPKQALLAPDFMLKSVTGRAMRLSEFRGRPILLHFWATFCSPCVRELPALQSLWRDYRRHGLVVLAVAADRGVGAVKTVAAFVQKGRYDFPVLLDGEGEVRNRYEVVALPTTYLIGRDGRFLGRIIGERDWSSGLARSLAGMLTD